MHGLAAKEAYIVLPVSPSMLFVAGHNDTWAKRLSAANPTEVVKRINLTIVSSSEEACMGSQ